jgi:hypothetical protein
LGFALSWIGVHGKPADTVLTELGWRRTGEQEDFPEADTTCAQLSNGWFVVVMIRSMDAYDGTIDASQLSRGGEVVACMLEEHVMASGFARWRDGQRLLAVDHDAQQGIRHLEVTGTPAPEMKEIIDEATSSQDKEDEGDADVDFIFDIPIDIAYRVTGYRHDRAELDGTVQKYDVIERLPQPTPQPRSWWSGLFRKRAV